MPSYAQPQEAGHSFTAHFLSECLGLTRLCPGRTGLSAKLSMRCVLTVWFEECQQGCHIQNFSFSTHTYNSTLNDSYLLLTSGAWKEKTKMILTWGKPMTGVIKGLRSVRTGISYNFPVNADKIQYKASKLCGKERKSKRLLVTIS